MIVLFLYEWLFRVKVVVHTIVATWPNHFFVIFNFEKVKFVHLKILSHPLNGIDYSISKTPCGLIFWVKTPYGLDERFNKKIIFRLATKR